MLKKENVSTIETYIGSFENVKLHTVFQDVIRKKYYIYTGYNVATKELVSFSEPGMETTNTYIESFEKALLKAYTERAEENKSISEDKQEDVDSKRLFASFSRKRSPSGRLATSKHKQ